VDCWTVSTDADEGPPAPKSLPRTFQSRGLGAFDVDLDEAWGRNLTADNEIVDGNGLNCDVSARRDDGLTAKDTFEFDGTVRYREEHEKKR
jgi:hypothetical protein